MKILLFANTDWYLYNFRLALAETIRASGHQLVLVSPQGKYSQRLLDLGYDWRELNFDTGSKAIAAQWRLLQDIWELYRQEKPDLVHHFTIKCSLFGGLAARLEGIPTIQSITGLGHVFTDRGLAVRLIRTGVKVLYRLACRRRGVRAIFQNDADCEYFVKSQLIAPEQAVVIRGSGANCQRFQPSDAPRHPGACRVVFASRLLAEKGVWEALAAVQQLRDEGRDVELLLAGSIYPDNPSSLTEDDLDAIASQDGVSVLGHVEDMPALFEKADIAILPSFYAEGTPRVLLEAGASGKPLVAADIPGCRGVVIPGENGELVPPKDVEALQAAIAKLLDPEVRRRYGARSREIVEQGFSEDSVIQRTLAEYAAISAYKLSPAASGGDDRPHEPSEPLFELRP